MAYRSVFRDGLLDGQVHLVTGGGTGIGRAIAHELHALGASVHLAARRPQPLERTATELGARASWSMVDVRDAERVDAVLDEVVERHGRLDGVVNNAGGQFPSRAEAITPNGWRAVVDVNLTGTFLVSRAAHRAWMGEHGGAIVSVVADMWSGFPGMSHTGAARAGVVNLTQSLAVEWAGSHIRVNAVAPGVIDSSGMETYAPEVRDAARASGRTMPAGRLGTEAEVASAVVFLLSPGAAYISGTTLRVDAGSSLVPRPLVPVGTDPPFPALRGWDE